MNKKYALGIDIGGTNSVFGLVDKNGEVVFEDSIATVGCEEAINLVDVIYSVLDKKNLIDKIQGIGIGAPNGNYYSGSIEFAPNLSWKGKIPLAKLFSEKFKVPATLTNDANAAALGEKKYGVAKNLSHFITITLGTGLGSGIIIDNQLLYGHDGFAGELGHIRVIPNGRPCGCGRKGCLETYASATGVVRSIKELESDNKHDSLLLKLIQPQATDIFNLAKQGDLFAQEIVDFTAKTLGEALANFTCFSSPEAYVLFGGIAQNGEEFTNKVKQYMENAILIIYQNKVKVITSELHHKNAAVLGASSLVWK